MYGIYHVSASEEVKVVLSQLFAAYLIAKAELSDHGCDSISADGMKGGLQAEACAERTEESQFDVGLVSILAINSVDS